MHCEFCAELSGSGDSRFAQTYRSLIAARIVAESDAFVALPTMGQLFRGSLLILPRVHVETCAELPVAARRELVAFLEEVWPTVGQFGDPVLFEHGAKAMTGGGCGIYHAHMHLVPLPVRTHPRSLFQEHRRSSDSLSEALTDLSSSREYLLIGNREVLLYAEVEEMAHRPASQYFRRVIAERFKTARHWDWRQSDAPEEDVLETISAFLGDDVVQRPHAPA